MGVNILSGLSKSKEKWEGGKIYNPKNGKTYKCTIWLEGNNLKVRGYLGIFYETQTWKNLRTSRCRTTRSLRMNKSCIV